MNVDKYKIDVSFCLNVREGQDLLTEEELKTYQEAVVGTLSDMFPGDTVQTVTNEDRRGIKDVSYEVVLANRGTHWMGDCEKIIRQLRKADAVFYARVEAWMFHDGPTRLFLGDAPQDRSNWIVVGMGKYYTNEGNTIETILPMAFVTTLLSYSTDGSDAVYASRILHEAIRSTPQMLAQPDAVLRIYRYGEPHEINLGH